MYVEYLHLKTFTVVLFHTHSGVNHYKKGTSSNFRLIQEQLNSTIVDFTQMQYKKSSYKNIYTVLN